MAKNSTAIVPNPNLGQHFTVDGRILKKMVSGIDDRTVVVEIGPGQGQLTEELSSVAKKVIAIEVDFQFKLDLLRLQKRCKNVHVIFEDALKVIDDIMATEKKANSKLRIISNLPYHITEPFVNKMIGFSNFEAVLMVGKKFGYQSKISDPNDPNFNELSYICRSFFKITKIADVSKEAFSPVPKTDSVILKFVPKSRKIDVGKVDFISQYLILGQKHGVLLKNALMKAFQIFEKQSTGTYQTKNSARTTVESLKLPAEMLVKSFAQLNNEEVKTLASVLN